ncbi:hypothetical protein [Amycolatopsis samaneae]|uniref:hypothetical protein n=1 Tax=Amycolatopsis samaneae TaxID=664691 RepID=UPI00360BF404
MFAGQGGPTIELADFASALGEKGLLRIKSTVDEQLADGGAGRRRDVAERLREELAEVRGDVDGLVALLSAKPPRVETSLKIVRVLRAAGRHGEAIAHAARALALDKPEPEPEPEDETVSLRRKEFDADPNRHTYAALRTAAVAAGRWAAHQRAASARLRELARAGEQGADEFAHVLLAEGRVDEAWHACVRFGASPGLRFELAELRSAEHPADAIPAYRARIGELIERRDPQSYREAALRLRKLRTLHRRAGSTDEFTEYLGELVETHRRKTRLIAEVRAARIALPKPRAAQPATS